MKQTNILSTPITHAVLLQALTLCSSNTFLIFEQSIIFLWMTCSMLSAFTDTIFLIGFINHTSTGLEKTPRLEGISCFSKPFSPTFPTTVQARWQLIQGLPPVSTAIKPFQLATLRNLLVQHRAVCAADGLPKKHLQQCDVKDVLTPNNVCMQHSSTSHLDVSALPLVFQYKDLELSAQQDPVLNCSPAWCTSRIFMFKVGGATGVNMTLITLLSHSSLSAQFLAAAGPCWADACSCLSCCYSEKLRLWKPVSVPHT